MGFTVGCSDQAVVPSPDSATLDAELGLFGRFAWGLPEFDGEAFAGEEGVDRDREARARGADVQGQRLAAQRQPRRQQPVGGVDGAQTAVAERATGGRSRSSSEWPSASSDAAVVDDSAIVTV